MQDQIMASGKWEFDKAVCDCFEDMLERSIPDYWTMRELLFEIGKRFIVPDSRILDIGCSNGKSLERFAQYADMLNKVYPDSHGIYVRGVDISEAFVEEARKRYSDAKHVIIENRDIATDFPDDEYDLVISCLTMQFVPIEHRQKIIRNIYKNLRTGGAFIMIEKLLGSTHDMNDMLVELYYDMKYKNGYSLEQIAAKKKSLEGVLVPLTEDWNKSLLRAEGFEQIECFWRCYNFAGFVAVKV